MQWFFVGFVISGVMAAIPDVTSMPVRIAMLAVALVLIAVGVAAYLASATGAGPAEAMALAWDPPIPFRWSYNLVQFGGALAGWLLGAAVGPGTIVVFVLLGPAVDLVRRTFPVLERAPATRPDGAPSDRAQGPSADLRAREEGGAGPGRPPCWT